MSAPRAPLRPAVHGAGDRQDRPRLEVLRQSLRAEPDPLALYRRLSDDGARADTLLLESSAGTAREPERSIIVARAALRLEARGGEARIRALTSGGMAMLPVVAGALESRAEVRREAESIRAIFAPPDPSGSDAERLLRPSPFDALRALLDPWVVEPQESRSLLMAAGLFAYDLIDAVERLPAPSGDHVVPDLAFWLPEQLVIVDHRRHTTTLATASVGGAGGEARHNDARSAIRALAAVVDAVPPAAPVDRVALPGGEAELAAEVDLSDEEFGDLVTRLKGHIERGDVFQIVPSRTFSAPCADPSAAYERLRRLNPSPFMFWLRTEDWTLFGASPESALSVRPDRTVEIRPIAGTTARGRHPDGAIDLDLDGRLEAALRLDGKELAEHMMLVDLARNDVARVSVPGSRHVPELLTVDRYSHVMHLVSTVRGTLRPGLDPLHAYAATLNMGTVMGAPKLKAAELLRRYEAGRRGTYGGAVGFLTGDGELRTAIVIRSALVRDGVAGVRAGAGIVHDSVPEREALETRRKAAAVLRALKGGEA